MRPIFLLSATLFSLSAVAVSDVATLNGNAFEGAEGIVAVNIAAGSFNNQSSNFIHSEGDVEVVYYSETPLVISANDPKIVIGNDVLVNAQGYLSIQMVAGNSNHQQNYIIFTNSEVEFSTLDNSDLSAQTVSGTTEMETTLSTSLNVVLAPDALKGAGGVIQVSQIAGTGNAARNTFQMPTTIN